MHAFTDHVSPHMGPASSVAGQERAQLLLAVLGLVDVVVNAIAVGITQALVSAALQEQLGDLDAGFPERTVEL